jgi:hypothetical protein
VLHVEANGTAEPQTVVAMSDNSHLPRKRAQETAAYIRDMAIELAAMARASQCETLISVLEMAEMEASRLAQTPSSNSRPPRA